MVFISRVLPVLDHPLNMYVTDSNLHQRVDTHCLLYYVLDDIVTGWNLENTSHEILAYCIRRSAGNTHPLHWNLSGSIDSTWTFAELREKNVTSEMLLSWSAPVDTAEDYQMFLNTLSPNASSLEKDEFHNCTSSWFGPHCLFAWDIPFDRFVAWHFQSKPPVKDRLDVPCYEHLHCTTSSVCLDWRNICDRKVDCLDGKDEIDCWQLEMNECSEEEYRCRNGQCIPIESFRDTWSDYDCADRTDEYAPISYMHNCPKDPAFRCEEHTCRHDLFDFPCGDGQCRREKTSDCVNGRNHFSPKDPCSRSMVCLTYDQNDYDFPDATWCREHCSNLSCVRNACPSQYEFPLEPLLSNHIRLIYTNTTGQSAVHGPLLPSYVCYNEELCNDVFPVTNMINGRTCRPFDQLQLENTHLFTNLGILIDGIKDRFRLCFIRPEPSEYRNHSSMYHCVNSSRYFSKHRLVDGWKDCPAGDDETFDRSCSLSDVRHRSPCFRNNQTRCLAFTRAPNGGEDCARREDKQLIEDQINFISICDGKADLAAIEIDGQNETDESHCLHWPCNNTYSRCDQYWLCPNGADEVNCFPSSCRADEHQCILWNDTSKVSCLPISEAGNGLVDCLGGFDERTRCVYRGKTDFFYALQCRNLSSCLDFPQFCDTHPDCPLGEDEHPSLCRTDQMTLEDTCLDFDPPSLTEVEQHLCGFLNIVKRRTSVYFKLDHTPSYARQISPLASPLPSTTSTRLGKNNTKAWLCHRGLPIRRWNQSNPEQLVCLCPPSYYGVRCEYQNQRVSVTLQVQVRSNWREGLTLVLRLIDAEQELQSSDHVEYSPIRDCQKKFHLVLLFATRPRNRSRNYSLRIDAFYRSTLTYRASWIFPVRFLFLPVYPLAVLLRIPRADPTVLDVCVPSCVHGRCMSYVNDPSSSFFCQCQSGWSGEQCQMKHHSTCAPQAYSIAGPICVCPLGRHGPRCSLSSVSCGADFCLHQGQCIPDDARHTPALANRPICHCPENYSGDRCEHRQTRLDIAFDSNVAIPKSLLVHLITVKVDSDPDRASLMKKIPFDHDSTSFYLSMQFNLAIAETSDQYYLITLLQEALISVDLVVEILPSQRCLSIDELFEPRRAREHLLRRIKFYHQPCEQHLDLMCFYDSVHFCLCDARRRANCFKFNHTMTYDCQGLNLCENDGHCFQNHPLCPTTLFCVCRDCYYGSRCQFSTLGSSLSLDTILGYQIRANTSIARQPLATRVAVALMITMFLLSSISNLMGLMTFRMQKTRDVGCGLYLFVSSIVSLMAISTLMIKFWILLATQMGLVLSRSFVYLQCMSLEFLIRLLLTTGDWLSACIAAERAVNISQGVSFSKSKSQKLAKRIIPLVFLFTGCTHLHDPFSRSLIDDEEEQRTWCIVRYSSSLQKLDQVWSVWHFFVPFGINCISALIVIFTAARTRSLIHKNKSYKQLLREQFQRHKHLLISPCILILLAIPRLYISFVSGCMQSARNPWPYLMGYFISFVPSTLTVVIFVLPSDLYKEQLRESIRRIWLH